MSTAVDNEIKRLADAAVDIASIPNPAVRHKGGFWLNSELTSLYENHLFSEDQRIDFMVIVKIMLDVIFRDAIEEVADLKPFEAFSSALEDHVRTAEKVAAVNDDPFKE